MRSSIFVAVAAVVALGLAGTAMAGPTAEEQTSAEQVKMCDDGLQACAAGEANSCVVAVKTCVGEKRQQAMQLMEES